MSRASRKEGGREGGREGGMNGMKTGRKKSKKEGKEEERAFPIHLLEFHFRKRGLRIKFLKLILCLCED